MKYLKPLLHLFLGILYSGIGFYSAFSVSFAFMLITSPAWYVYLISYSLIGAGIYLTVHGVNHILKFYNEK